MEQLADQQQQIQTFKAAAAKNMDKDLQMVQPGVCLRLSFVSCARGDIGGTVA